MKEIFARIEKIKLVPVVKLDRAEDALPLGKALLDGGLPAAEVTFRTAAAAASIRAMTEAYPQMLVGAGTVINVEQARRAMDAGAKFIVSPGFSARVVEFARANDLPILPGACTPTEIMMALDHGLEIVKFFPANLFGGLSGIKALAPVFPAMRFMPTGGVSAENLAEFIAYDRIAAVGGSWMVKDTLIRAGNFAAITRLTAEAAALIKRGGGQ